jgi:hypothetical protein
MEMAQLKKSEQKWGNVKIGLELLRFLGFWKRYHNIGTLTVHSNVHTGTLQQGKR